MTKYYLEFIAAAILYFETESYLKSIQGKKADTKTVLLESISL